MVFSSLIFTFYFLPVVIVLYYLSKEKYRNYILLVASLFFYAYGEPSFVFIMIASIIINFLMALSVDKYRDSTIAKIILIFDIIMNIGILFYFKYFDFAIDVFSELTGHVFHKVGIELPIGISFFTFQALSYVIDVYKGTVKVQKNPLIVALYISFFPQLIAGPIIRYSTIESQIECRVCSKELFAGGVRRFMLGFAKKVILANNLALVAQDAFSCDVCNSNILFLWVGSICFSLQIYYDFSGYSDMAIGLGAIFGFKFEENFNYPYISKTISEFWRRWHISLGQWFRDYVYIPLGGSRCSFTKHVVNLFIVWLFTGIWHGANYTFLVWGIGYFILLIFEKFILKPSCRNKLIKVLWQIGVLLCVNFGWVIFNSDTVVSGIKYCLAMLGRYNNCIAIDPNIIFYFHQYGAFIILGLLFAMPIVKVFRDKVEKAGFSCALNVLEPIGYSIVFIWSVSYLILGAHNPFIYFNF